LVEGVLAPAAYCWLCWSRAEELLSAAQRDRPVTWTCRLQVFTPEQRLERFIRTLQRTRAPAELLSMAAEMLVGRVKATHQRLSPPLESFVRQHWRPSA
jgi:hypothetical protein